MLKAGILKSGVTGWRRVTPRDHEVTAAYAQRAWADSDLAGHVPAVIANDEGGVSVVLDIHVPTLPSPRWVQSADEAAERKEPIGDYESGASLPGIVGGLQARVGVLERPQVKVSARVSVQGTSVPDLSLTQCQFGTVEYDSHGLVDDANNRFNIKVPGVYVVCLMVEFQSNASGERQATIVHNGVVRAKADTKAVTISPGTTGLSPATTFRCEADDFVRASVRQSSGSTLNIDQGEITIQWVSP